MGQLLFLLLVVVVVVVVVVVYSFSNILIVVVVCKVFCLLLSYFSFSPQFRIFLYSIRIVSWYWRRYFIIIISSFKNTVLTY